MAWNNLSISKLATGSVVKFGKWINNFIQLFIIKFCCVSILGYKLNHVCHRLPRELCWTSQLAFMKFVRLWIFSQQIMRNLKYQYIKWHWISYRVIHAPHKDTEPLDWLPLKYTEPKLFITVTVDVLFPALCPLQARFWLQSCMFVQRYLWLINNPNTFSLFRW